MTSGAMVGVLWAQSAEAQVPLPWIIPRGLARGGPWGERQEESPLWDVLPHTLRVLLQRGHHTQIICLNSKVSREAKQRRTGKKL